MEVPCRSIAHGSPLRARCAWKSIVGAFRKEVHCRSACRCVRAVSQVRFYVKCEEDNARHALHAQERLLVSQAAQP